MSTAEDANERSWYPSARLSKDSAMTSIIRCTTPGATWGDLDKDLSCKELSVDDLKSLVQSLDLSAHLGSQHLCLRLGYQAPLLELNHEHEIDISFDPMRRIEEWVETADLFLKVKSLAPEKCQIVTIDNCRPGMAYQATEKSLEELDPMLTLILASHPLVRRRYADLRIHTDTCSGEAVLSTDALLIHTESFRNRCWRNWCETRQNRINAAQQKEELESAMHTIKDSRQEIKSLREALKRAQSSEAKLREQLAKKESAHKHSLALIRRLEPEILKVKELYKALKEKSKAMRKKINQVEEKSQADIDKLFATQIELEEVFADKQSIQALCIAQAETLKRAESLMQQLAQLRGLPNQTPHVSIQMLALLEAYRHSLKRAERLLLGGS